MRLLPFEPSNGGLGIEGAGPTGGFFRVLANPDHAFEEEATEGGRWSQLGIAEVWGQMDPGNGILAMEWSLPLTEMRSSNATKRGINVLFSYQFRGGKFSFASIHTR